MARLVRLGLQWSSDSELLFLDGRIRYEIGEVVDGISFMRIATRKAEQEGTLDPARLLFLGEALLKHGGNEGQSEGLGVIEDSLRQGCLLSAQIADEFVRAAVDLREYRAIARGLVRSGGDANRYELVKAIIPMLADPEMIRFCSAEILDAFLLSLA